MSVTIDVHDLYNSIKSIQNQKEKKHKEIAEYIISEINNNLKNGKFTVEDEGTTIKTNVKWKWVKERKRRRKTNVTVGPNASFDSNLLTTNLKSALRTFEVRVSHKEERKSKVSLFPIRSALKHVHGMKRLLKLFAFPVDLISIPAVVVYNGIWDIKRINFSVPYSTTITITISKQMLDDIESLKPDGEGYLQAKERFETMQMLRGEE